MNFTKRLLITALFVCCILSSVYAVIENDYSPSATMARRRQAKENLLIQIRNVESKIKDINNDIDFYSEKRKAMGGQIDGNIGSSIVGGLSYDECTREINKLEDRRSVLQQQLQELINSYNNL